MLKEYRKYIFNPHLRGLWINILAVLGQCDEWNYHCAISVSGAMVDVDCSEEFYKKAEELCVEKFNQFEEIIEVASKECVVKLLDDERLCSD